MIANEYLESFTPQEEVIIKECLFACLDFLSDDEFSTLLGVSEAEFREIASAWPKNKQSKDINAVVNNCLNNFLYYPRIRENDDERHRNALEILAKMNAKAVGPKVYDTKTLIQYSATKEVGFVFFCEHCFSQWYPSCFVVNAIIYPTAEHYMMAEKARLFSDEVSLEKILKAQSPEEATMLGRQIQGFDDERWKAKRQDIAFAGNAAKFRQNAKMRELLMSMKGSVIVQASPTDPVWGIGLAAEHSNARDPRKWKGLNLLGFILMRVRDEI